MNKLVDKGKGINFDEEADAPPTSRQDMPQQPRTSMGAISASLVLGRGVEAENRALKEKLKEFEEVSLVALLDPRSVRASQFANRHEASFDGTEFDTLRADIAAAGRNVQPIKLRRIRAADAGSEFQYEIVFGHRRHRACLELGLPVAAVVQDLSDAELFAEMDRENRERANLSPWEQGVMYKRALDVGLYPSLRKLALALGVQAGNASTAIQLASLPAAVVEAFGSPLELQYRWAPKIQVALDADPAGVFRRAEEVKQSGQKLPGKKVLAILLGLETSPASEASSIVRDGKVVGSIERSKRGGLEVQFKPGALSHEQERKLTEFLAGLVGGQIVAAQ